MNDQQNVLPRAIGGYFESSISTESYAPFHPAALAFQSARSAFFALLQQRKPRCVWVPDYGCGSMLEPLLVAGVPTKTYNVSSQLRFATEIALADDDIILVVNYFGVSGALIDHALSVFPAMQVVIDNAQAFFAPPRTCLANIYSPRKFVGVADGGYLVSTMPFAAPVAEDVESVHYQQHLHIRAQQGPEAGYALYLEAENRLKLSRTDCAVRAMSATTQHLLQQLDYRQIMDARRGNFATMHAWLQPLNALRLAPNLDDVPLCYPFIPKPNLSRLCATDCRETRAKLAADRVYVATYWPELLPDTNSNTSVSAASELAQNLLALPIDQRLTADDVLRLKSLLTKLLGV